MKSTNSEKMIAVDWSSEVLQANKAIDGAIVAGIDYVLLRDNALDVRNSPIVEAMITRAEAFEKNGFVESWENGLLLCKTNLFRRYGLLDECCADLYEAVSCYVQHINNFGFSLVGVCGELADKFNPGIGLREKLKAASLEKREKPRVLFEFSNMNPFHCGTSEYQLALLRYFGQLYSEKYKIIVRCNQAAANFHGIIDLCETVCMLDDEVPVCDIALVASQPVDANQQVFLNSHALRVVCTMLDCILLRTGYLVANAPNLQDTVRAGLRYADGVVAISEFSNADFKNYFAQDALIAQKNSRVVRIATDFGGDLSQQRAEMDLPFDEYVLVVGNRYRHKALEEVFNAVRDDSRKYVFVGMDRDGMIGPNAMSFRTDFLEESILDELYAHSSCVVFPSQYEGFGLPITIALKHQKPVVVSDNMLNKEIAALFDEHAEQFIFFDRFEDVPKAVSHALDFHGVPSDFSHSWREAIIEVEDFLAELLSEPVNWNLLDERMWFYRTMQTEQAVAFQAGKASVGIKQLVKERISDAVKLIPAGKSS